MATMKQRRDRLVTRQVEARGVRDPLVLAAMKAVRRELFVPEDLRDEAYDDTPLPIGSGQTISQPYIVAFMIEALALRGGEKLLEIGAGSGYAAAVLAELPAKSSRSNASDSLPREQRQISPKPAARTSMCAMRTAPRAGATRLPSMRSSSRQARQMSRGR
jgi:hypothetical protein